MPGFDGTGPRGTGLMTGGGRGFCIARVDVRSDLPGTPPQIAQDVAAGVLEPATAISPAQLGRCRGRRGRGWMRGRGAWRTR